MAVLSVGDRQALWRDVMSRRPEGVVFTVTKITLAALVDACDEVLDENAGALNAAVQAKNSAWNTLPVPLRAFIFAHTLLKRFGAGS